MMNRTAASFLLGASTLALAAAVAAAPAPKGASGSAVAANDKGALLQRT